jgi:hypothetical protein
MMKAIFGIIEVAIAVTLCFLYDFAMSVVHKDKVSLLKKKLYDE